MRFSKSLVAFGLLGFLMSLPSAASAQPAGQWINKSIPGQSCWAGTGYATGGDDGFQGIMLLVWHDRQSQALILVSLNVTEAKALGISEARNDVPLHLTFSNPDLGNAFIVIHTSAAANDGSPGWNLGGVIDEGGLKFLRQYQTLDVYLAGTDIRLRRIKLGHSGPALDALADCARTSLNPH